MIDILLRLRHRPLPVILFICLYSSVGKATTVVMPTDLNMIIGSRSIVRGKVVSISAAFDEKAGLVCTYVRLKVREVLKGDISSREITLKEPGGEASDRGSVVFGAPQFEVGEHVLVYLDSWPDGSLRVHEMLLGKFSITKDPPSGQLLAVRNTEGAHVEVLPNSSSAGSDSPGVGGAGTNGEAITSRMELNAYTAIVRKKLAANLEQARSFESRYYAGIPMLSDPPDYGNRVRAGGLEPQFHIFNPACRYFEPDNGQPVSFSVNPDGAPNPHIMDDIAAVMHTWSSVPGCALQVVNAGTVSTCRGVGGSLIYFNNCDGMFSASSGCAAIIALGGFHTLDSSTTRVVNGMTFDRILRSFVTFNPFATCYFGDHCSVQEITTHEMGHALGLGHSWDATFPGSPTGIELAATMYFVAHFDGRCSSLKSDDINAIKFVYPGTNPGLGSLLPLAIGSQSPLPGGYPATPYTQSLVASGGVIPYTWSLMAGTLPDGLVMTSDGFIWGRPGTAGDFTFTAKLVDAGSQTLQANFTITIALGSPPTDAARFVSQTMPAVVDPGQSFNVTMVWNNTGIEPWSDSAGFSLTAQNPSNNTTWGGNRVGLSGAIITPNRQTGMTFTAVAPSEPGTYQFQWQWQKDGVGFFGDMSPNASIVVRQPAPPLFITSGALSNGSLGSPFLQELTATGGVPPYAWSIVSGGLPPGLAIDGATQSIKGTPSAAGTFSFTLLVTDSMSTSSQKPASITIIAQPLSIQTSTIPAAIAGLSYTQQLTLVGGVSPYTWSITSGALPSGLSLDQVAGIVSGTTSQKGSFNFIATVRDHAGSTASKAYQLNVVAANSVPQLDSVKYKASGRKLIVRGQNFDPAAVLVVDENQTAGRVSGSDTITAKPVGLTAGQHSVRAMNPNGAASNTISLTVN
jgi:hypothetical protein